jgi:hypothetical protein
MRDDRMHQKKNTICPGRLTYKTIAALGCIIPILLSWNILKAQQVDAGVISVTIPAPNGTIYPHQLFRPSARIGNTGSVSLSEIPMRCEIINPGGSVVYVSNKSVSFLPLRADSSVTFDDVKEGLPCGTYRVRVSVFCVYDLNPTNDRIVSSFFVNWGYGASMLSPRQGHTANRLSDGRVLVIAGDWMTKMDKTCEIYTPDSNNGMGRWNSAASLSTPRGVHTATTLADGRIFVAGGVNQNFGRDRSCEIFTPRVDNPAGEWQRVDSMTTGRSSHTATLLLNGKILIAGGLTQDGVTATCELFDPSANNGRGVWSSCPPMKIPRYECTATLLTDGKVLVTGGYNARYEIERSCELFDPAADGGKGTWTSTAAMMSAKVGHSAVRLANGKVFVTGGTSNQHEIFDPIGNGKWNYINSTSSMEVLTKATLLPDGRVLVSGDGTVFCEIYDPTAANGAGAMSRGPAMNTQRRGYTITNLSDGRLLAAGGVTGSSPTTSCEIFDTTESRTVILPSRLHLAAVTPDTPMVHQPFTVAVELCDEQGIPQNVKMPTKVHLSLAKGTGALYGSLSGTITAGENRIQFSEVMYSVGEDSIRICAAADSGSALLADTSTSFVVRTSLLLQQPLTVAVDPGNKCATLTWEKSPEKEVIKYLVFLGTHPDSLLAVDSSMNREITSIMIHGLTNDSSYYFSIVAVDSFGHHSPGSAIVSTQPSFFSPHPLSGLEPFASEMAAWCDFTGDGLLDVVRAGFAGGKGNAIVYENMGHETFKNISVSLTPIGDGQVGWCDSNNDNLPDIILAGTNSPPSYGGVTELDINIGNNQFREIKNPFNTFGNSFASGDYDNDGREDLIVSGWTGSIKKTILYHNDGGGHYSATPITFLPSEYSTFSWVDVDNDGDLDLFYAGGQEPSFTDIYRNDGPGKDSGWTFTKMNAQFRTINGSEGKATWGDFDNDGDLDVIIVGWDPIKFTVASVYYANDGKGNFTPSTESGLPPTDGPVCCGDYDGDGVLDVAFSTFVTTEQAPFCYHNAGNGKFTRMHSVPHYYIHNVAWGDYDNDGDLDLYAFTNWTDATMSVIYRNNLNIVNTRPSSPEGLHSTVLGNTVRLAWARARDNETPPAGLSYNLAIGTTRGGCEIMSPMADLSTGWRKIIRLGNVNQDTAWQIRNLPNGRYYWTVQAIDASFSGSRFACIDSFTIKITDVHSGSTDVPREFALAQNFPNPFNPSTTIRFSLPHTSFVSLKIFDALGRQVSVVVSEELAAGNYSRRWNAESLPSGMYFYRLQAGSFTDAKKLLLLR